MIFEVGLRIQATLLCLLGAAFRSLTGLRILALSKGEVHIKQSALQHELPHTPQVANTKFESLETCVDELPTDLACPQEAPQML